MAFLHIRPAGNDAVRILSRLLPAGLQVQPAYSTSRAVRRCPTSCLWAMRQSGVCMYGRMI